MKFGILGTGNVGQTIATKLVGLGHPVKIGSRTADNEKAVVWACLNGSSASNGTFRDATAFGEIIFNCTPGRVSLEVLETAGKDNLKGKIIVDVANPFMVGEYLSLIPSLCNTTSLGEEIQKHFPEAKVVKTLNTVLYSLMVEPSLLDGNHDTFICSDHEDAKEKVKEILHLFGWENPVDLGELAAARYTEMLGAFWMPVFKATKNPLFNFKIVRNNL